MSVQNALAQMNDRDFAAYVEQLRRYDAIERAREGRDEHLGFTADEPGYPLGRGWPLGSTLRQDGESHREAWARVVRADPCSYCSKPGPATTVDHIEPRSRATRGLGGAHTWLNFTASCPGCNTGKKDGTMLEYLRRRAVAGAR